MGKLICDSVGMWESTGVVIGGLKSDWHALKCSARRFSDWDSVVVGGEEDVD